ncbi:HAD family hydrolase [Roseivirga thermotolerans]|uniref:HAD family hydrolase n=1 Tax=Roseivirga thermotolerans TaxID=1758176 RepID=UPI00273F17D8|nr:HAD family phosphatase [Roseivirga thermotolerans]
MQTEISNLSYIIFDLGGVIIDLDVEATYQAFAQLSGMPLDRVKEFAASEEFFKQYERGEIDDPTFRAHLREGLRFTGGEALLDEAWNAMLGPIAAERFKKLEELANNYSLFVMSNTNEIHVRRFLQIARHTSPHKDFYDYFKQVYLSQEVGARKPEPKAWQVILDDHGLIPSKGLFIDDNLSNIKAAAALGLNTYHNQSVNDWMKLF